MSGVGVNKFLQEFGKSTILLDMNTLLNTLLSNEKKIKKKKKRKNKFHS